MVITRSNAAHGEEGGSSEQSAHEVTPQNDTLAQIAAKLSVLDDLKAEVTALKVQTRSNSGKAKMRQYTDDSGDENDHHRRFPRSKVEFPKFSGGDPRGWVLKAEKYFRYYGTSEEDKVEIAAMHPEGDALDLFSWISAERTLLYWEEFIKIIEEHYEPPEYLNPDEHFVLIKQTGSVQDYRQEWARRVARVQNWPDHCLLGVFIAGLREDLRSEVKIHKPKSVFRASSLALEFEKRNAPVHFKTSSMGSATCTLRILKLNTSLARYKI
ncbi:unnamed protein product [Cuscuta campestris]|uniref:Retrotransposon gag domain-containing protein n=1 Tax=Cuscuta campestris TaxID=132261 RepID=A0A484NP05_9ASTE|nr:unnamed protein product [Cuscuta campestris]